MSQEDKRKPTQLDRRMSRERERRGTSGASEEARDRDRHEGRPGAGRATGSEESLRSTDREQEDLRSGS